MTYFEHHEVALTMEPFRGVVGAILHHLGEWIQVLLDRKVFVGFLTLHVLVEEISIRGY